MGRSYPSILIAGQPPGGSRLADLLLPRRAARLDHWSVLLIANVDDAPRDASSAREVKDLRVAAGNAITSVTGSLNAGLPVSILPWPGALGGDPARPSSEWLSASYGPECLMAMQPVTPALHLTLLPLTYLDFLLTLLLITKP